MVSYYRCCCYVGIIYYLLFYCNMTTNAQNIKIYRLEECDEMTKDHLHKEGYYIFAHKDRAHFTSFFEYTQWTKYDMEGNEVSFSWVGDPTGCVHYLCKPFSENSSIFNEVDQDFSMSVNLDVKLAEDDIILYVTFFNNGKKTFVIDKEIAMSLKIGCFNKDKRVISSDGSKIIHKNIDDFTVIPRSLEANPTAEEWKYRLLNLAPGEGFTKKICLTKGWRNTDLSISPGWPDYFADYTCFLPKEESTNIDKILINTHNLNDNERELFFEATGLSCTEYTFYDASPQYFLIKFENPYTVSLSDCVKKSVEKEGTLVQEF